MSEASVAVEALPGAWERTCEAVRAHVGDTNFTTWIAPLRCRWTDRTVLLEAPDATARERIARHFLRLLEEQLALELGARWPVQLAVSTPAPELPIRVRQPTTAHTFEQFVTGESNARAHAAARALCAGTTQGPLLVHGPSGVGKTHLLHAVFHALAARGERVACLPAAQLVTSLVAAYQAHRHDRFWADLAGLHALLLDDIHSLAGQPEVQERLLDGLRRWVEGRRALVLTSDRPLDAMPGLTARLGEDFADGLVVAITPAEPALRLAILQAKARAQGLELDRHLAARIAVAVGGSIRRLEGALTRLLAHARLQGRRVDEALALEVLPDLRARVAAAPLLLECIVEATATAFGTTARRLYGRARRQDLPLARHVAMYLARKLLAQPYVQLAAAFDRDHSTVLYAWRVISTRLRSDERLAERVAAIERQLGIRED